MLEISCWGSKMDETIADFQERQNEIRFYYDTISHLPDADDEHKRLFKIMKANFLLMLYNLIESTITNGFLELYKAINDEGAAYKSIIHELQLLWAEYEVSQIYSPTTLRKTYVKRMQEVADIVANERKISMEDSNLDAEGNLDARKIKNICDHHGIRYTLSANGDCLYIIKTKRNNLSHGDLSFSECGRDFTIEDLCQMMNETFTFLSDILKGMKEYEVKKKYLISRN